MKTDRMALFLTGLGIGLTAAILLAPASGEETRRRIKKGADDAADMVQERVNALKTNVTETVADARQRIADTLRKGRDTADAAIAKSRDITHSVGVQVEQVGKQLQDV